MEKLSDLTGFLQCKLHGPGDVAFSHDHNMLTNKKRKKKLK